MNPEGNIETQKEAHKPTPTPAPAPGIVSVTIKSVFGDSQIVNVVTVPPYNITVLTDGQPFASATTTDLDPQSSFTISPNADGSFPVVTVQ